VKVGSTDVSLSGFSHFYLNAIRLHPLLKQLFFSGPVENVGQNLLRLVQKAGDSRMAKSTNKFPLYSDVQNRITTTIETAN
jgi:hypothetical protein